MAEAETLPDGAAVPSGRDRWLQKSAVDPAERLPVFSEAMAMVAESWTGSFCALSASEGEVVFLGLSAGKVEDLPGRRSSLPIFAALRVPAWEALAGLGLDRDVVSTVVEAFFGGGDEPDEEKAGAGSRPVSPIEARIVDVIGGQVATSLTTALKLILPTRIEFDRTMPKPEATFLGKPPTAVLVASFELRTLGRAGTIDVIFPQAAIDAHATTWAGDQADILDEAGWTRQLKSEVSRASLRVEAEIPMRGMTLGSIAGLRVGQVLELAAGSSAAVQLRAGAERLFRCHLGQSAGFYTVRIDEPLPRDAQSPRKGR